MAAVVADEFHAEADKSRAFRLAGVLAGFLNFVNHTCVHFVPFTYKTPYLNEKRGRDFVRHTARLLVLPYETFCFCTEGVVLFHLPPSLSER